MKLIRAIRTLDRYEGCYILWAGPWLIWTNNILLLL